MASACSSLISGSKVWYQWVPTSEIVRPPLDLADLLPRFVQDAVGLLRPDPRPTARRRQHLRVHVPHPSQLSPLEHADHPVECHLLAIDDHVQPAPGAEPT